MAFSRATYGPGKRTEGILDHISKELGEVSNATDDAVYAENAERTEEWVDLVILSLDGLSRQLLFYADEPTDPDFVAQLVCRLIAAKQSKNEGRVWPNWRDMPKDKAIEHDRSQETS